MCGRGAGGCFRVSKFLSFRVTKFPSFQVSKFPREEGGREDQWEAWNWSCDLRANERPKKNCTRWCRHTHTRTWRLFDSLVKIRNHQFKDIHQICWEFLATKHLLFINWTVIFFIDRKLWWQSSITAFRLGNCLLNNWNYATTKKNSLSVIACSLFSDNMREKKEAGII